MCTESVITKLLTEADKDKDNRISFQEFVDMMAQYRDAHDVFSSTTKTTDKK